MGRGSAPGPGPADHGSRTSAHLGVLFLHRTTAAAVAGVSQRRDHPVYIGIPGGAGAAVRHAHKGPRLARRLGLGLRHGAPAGSVVVGGDRVGQGFPGASSGIYHALAEPMRDTMIGALNGVDTMPSNVFGPLILFYPWPTSCLV